MALGLLWKQKGLGSQEALGALKKALALPGKSREGIGHTGILDPFAEGLLLCGTEEGTKLLNPLVGLDKTYEATMLLGWSTDTLDSEGERIDAEGTTAEALRDWLAQDLALIEFELKDLLSSKAQSSFEQVPPQFSAVHVDGKRAYEWARKGVQKELKSKNVKVYEATHLGLRRSEKGDLLWDFSVRVSAGTYIRAFARDWALELCHFPAHLTRLLRTSVGPLAMPAPQNPSLDANLESWQPLLLEDLKTLFDIHYLTPDETQRLRAHGQWKPKPHPRPCLLMGSQDHGPVAWTEAQTGKIGRVFVRNPLA